MWLYLSGMSFEGQLYSAGIIVCPDQWQTLDRGGVHLLQAQVLLVALLQLADRAQVSFLAQQLCVSPTAWRTAHHTQWRYFQPGMI